MKRIAVALHDVEPATFERCALIRDWLDDHGIDRVTLFVVPAPELHPFADRSPELAIWLSERRRCGDAIAQLGLEHRSGEFRPDLNPATSTGPKQVWAFEQLLRRAHGREAVTYDDVAGAL